MSSVPSGKRKWNCPDCGGEVLLSITQLDPIACETCMAKMKGHSGSARTSTTVTNPTNSDVPAGPLGVWQSLPVTTKLAIAAMSCVVGLLLGLTVGFMVGKGTAPAATAVTRGSSNASSSAPKAEPQEEERPEAPGPGYKWVRGRERKDGTRGTGHWAKDPLYRPEEAAPVKEAPPAKKKASSGARDF